MCARLLLVLGEFDEEDLLCGAHMPYDEKSAAELRASGEAPSPLHNNCSGKHAGMLLASQVMDVTSVRYIDPAHPLQVLMRSTLADFAGVDADEIPIAIDGCGVPAFYLSLYRAALAYARLLSPAERYAESASTVVEAMTSFPYYVAGSWSMTTPLLAAFNGELVAKEGAEGFYAMALNSALTPRLAVDDDCTVGIALKIDDGSMDRGRNPVVLRLLEMLGVELDETLLPYKQWELRNHSGTVVGEVQAQFSLEVL